MRWFLAGLVVFIAAAGGALFVVPRMVDWNAYRPDIAALVEGMTGRKLAIDGDVRLVLLPTPTLSASGVRLRNIDGASTPDMILLKSLDARVALTPLLKGRVVVESMVLVEPAIILERLPDGRPNWRFLRPPIMDFVDDVGDDLAVNRLIIVGGTLSVANAGRIERLSGINAEIMAERLAGPIRVQGDVTWRGLPWRVDVGTGRFSPLQTTQVTATLGLRGGGSEVRFAGGATLSPGHSILAGGLRADLTRFRDILAALEFPLPAELGQRTTVELAMTLDEDRLGLDGINIRMADARITGSAAIPLKPDGVGEATLKVGLIDLDKWPVTPTPDASAPPIDALATVNALSRLAPGRWSIQGEGLRLRDTLLRDWRLAADVSAGSVMLREVSGHLPGGTDLVAYGVASLGTVPAFKGSIEFGTEALRQPWAWLGLPLPPADQDRLRQASLTASVSIAADAIAVDDLKLRLDGSRIAGAVGVRLGGVRPAVSAALTLDGVNLGAYWPSGLPLSAETGALLRRIDAVVALRTGPVTFGETAVDSVDLQGELRDGAVTFTRAALALKEDRLTFRGTVAAGPDPALDLAVDGAMADLRPWLRLGGLDAPQADLGSASVTMKLSGTMNAPKISGELTLGDGGVKASGAVSLSPSLELEISAASSSLPRFILRLMPEFGLMADVTRPSVLELKAARTATGWRVERGELGLGGGRVSLAGNLAPSGLDVDLAVQGITATAATISAAYERARGLCCGGPTEPFDGVMRLRVIGAALAGIAVDDGAATVAFSPAGWTLNEASFRLWNGNGAADGSPWRPEGMRVLVRGLDVAVMSSLIDMERRLAGRLSGAAQIVVDPATGRLAGGGRLAVQGLVLPGLDLVGAATALDPAPTTALAVDRSVAAFSRALNEGSAGPGYLQARFRIDNGEIRLEDGALQTVGLLAALEGRVDLAGQKLEGSAVLRSTRIGGLPPTAVRIGGSPDRPILREDLIPLRAHLAPKTPPAGNGD